MELRAHHEASKLERAGPLRPLLFVCVAVVAGSWLGGTGVLGGPGGPGDPGDPADLGETVGSACTGVLAVSVWRGLAALAALAWLASTLASRRQVARWTCIALVMATAGLRARLALPEDAERDAAVKGRLFVGTFDETGSGAGLVRGRIGGNTTTFALPAGIVETGETIAIVPSKDAQRLAAGPVPGPRGSRNLGGQRGPGGPRAAVDVSADEVARVAPEDSSALNAGALVAHGVRALRTRLLARTATIRDPATRGLVAALLFGDTSELPPDVPDLFVRTGTFHVLAVSGQQVVLVLALLIAPLVATLVRVLRTLSAGRARASPSWFEALLIALFVPIAGAGAPVVRSAIGCALSAFAPRIRARSAAVVGTDASRTRVKLESRADALSLWCLALILECTLHPDAPSSLSVQLSYAATLGLLVGTRPIRRVLRRMAGEDGWIAPVGRTGRARSPWVRIPLERALDALCTALAASTAAVIATLPFTWARLGEWSPLGVLATPALTPSMALLLVLGWVRVIVPPLAPDVLLEPCAHAMTASMRVFDLLPGTPVPLPPRPFVLVLLVCVLAIVACARPDRPWIRRATALLTAILVLPWSLAPRRFELWALDVGAGTATVLRGPGIGTWIFDAGSRDRPDVAREALAPLLRDLDVGTLGIALSHTDRDHDGALPWIVERWRPAVFCGALPAHLGERLPHSTLRIDLGAGRVDLPPLDGPCPGFALTLERGLDQAGNEGSRILGVRAGDDVVLLCGDAEAEGLAAWMHARTGDGHVRLVLWPHHGSDMDLVGPFLRAIAPTEVWFSAGSDPPISAELERRGIPWRSTARDGPLDLSLPP